MDYADSPLPPEPDARSEAFRTAVRQAAEIAGAAADDVDRSSRFPHESLAAFKEGRLLSALISPELGGMGATVGEVADAVRTTASQCAASALLLAMHSIDVANLVRLGTSGALLDLQREIVGSQLLCANANSEVGLGGDMTRSKCAVESDNGRLTLIKEALAISFGEQADLIFACARRSPESEESDRVQVICRRPQLEPLNDWDAMGLRGTGSRTFRITAEIEPELIYAAPFADISGTGGTQNTLLLLSSVWVGIAEAATAKAHAYVRAAARRAIGTLPKSALRLAELSTRLDQVRAVHRSACLQVDAAAGAETMDDPALIATLRSLKVQTSEGAVSVVQSALEICGIAGYVRGTPFSLDRHFRDACGGLVMVSNDRLLYANAEMMGVRKNL